MRSKWEGLREWHQTNLDYIYPFAIAMVGVGGMALGKMAGSWIVTFTGAGICIAGNWLQIHGAVRRRWAREAVEALRGPSESPMQSPPQMSPAMQAAMQAKAQALAQVGIGNWQNWQGFSQQGLAAQAQSMQNQLQNRYYRNQAEAAQQGLSTTQWSEEAIEKLWKDVSKGMEGAGLEGEENQNDQNNHWG